MYRNLSFLLCFFLFTGISLEPHAYFKLALWYMFWAVSTPHAYFELACAFRPFSIRLSILVLFHVSLAHRDFSFSVCVFQVGIVVPWEVDVETCFGRFYPCMRISSWPCGTLHAYFELACAFHPISELAHRNFSFSVCAFQFGIVVPW